MSEPLLEARALSVRVGAVHAVRALDFSLRAGDRVAVLGRNGVGKSTLLAALAGLHPHEAGAVHYLDRPLQTWPARELACVRAWLSQHPEDPFAGSVLDAVLTGRHPWLGRFDWEGVAEQACAREALAAMALTGFEARNVQMLSGGERQRVALAAVLAQTPRAYLLDEPLTHLDLASQVRVLAHFRTLAEAGAGVIMVIHDLNLALSWANRLLMLQGEGAWECGSRESLAQADPLGRALGFPLRAVADGEDTIFVAARL
ncbi:ABC transporter ATP-binding protein [Niveibacterium sp. SC-1]|uniref:ABC transporter ATP-binding protein n=1 Tax=Niveibacterium sp. SC-1 TaxID=3135646 RepID=UPI00311D6DDF